MTNISPSGSVLDVLTQDAAFGTASKGMAVFGKYQATPTSYTDGDAAPILLDANGRIALSSDIQIGAVELKDVDTDNRANIKAANTARTTGTLVIATQPIDAAGVVLSTSALATAAKQDTQDASINTLLKPANTLAGVTTVAAVTNLAQQGGVAISLNTGVRDTGTQRVTIATNDLVPISAASLPLPTGAATETTLSALNTKTNTEITSDYDTGVGTQTMKLVGVALPASGGAVPGGTATAPIRTDPTGTTIQPVSATSLPLPAGATTAAKQDILLTELQLKADLTETQPVSLASVPLPTGAATETTLAGVKTGTDKIPAQGQALMAASTPVAIASNQSAVPVSGTVTANLGTIADVATQTTLALVKAMTDNLDVALSTRVATSDIQPSSAGSIFNAALPAVEANWFGADISITAGGTMRIVAQVTIAGILRASITRSAITKSLNLNQNGALSASALYAFDIPVKSGDTFNLRYSATTGTIDYCEVQFIRGAS